MIEPNPKGEVWLFAEQEDERLSETTLELCSKARELADQLGVKVGAVLVGYNVRELSYLLIAHDRSLPEAPRAQASWNYRMADCADLADGVRITYDMTRLQRLDTSERFLVSLNAGNDVQVERIIERMTYYHPQFTPQSVAAQALLPGMRDGVTAFAGAYHGWGFHEDGALSGLRAAESLGGSW